MPDTVPPGDRPDLAEMTRCQEMTDAPGRPETLGDLIAERAATLGDKVACNWFQDERTLSFKDLHRQADRLAHSLSALGIRKGAHVAVMLPNVPETMITWTAIGRLGAVMVPINTAYTATELSFVLNDADAQFIVIDENFVDLLDEMPDRPDLLTTQNVIVHGQPREGEQALTELIRDGAHPFEPPTPVFGSDLLNIQYTSGTTGFPKGCMLTHDYWMRTGYTLAITRGPEEGIRNVLVWAPFFYMDGMWQILSAFYLSATTYVARKMSISHFFDWLHAFDINTCTFPEIALKAHPASDDDARLNLQYIYSFGWRPESKREAERRFGCAARDAYGMTELGTATATPFSAGEWNFQRTCGLPMPDRQLKIVDENGDPLRQGADGELWVTGPGIMWGYYKRPAANAGVFNGRWFRTGDIFRQDENGYYHIVGRMKDMVKRSGENIAAREVEAVLNGIDGILESAILPVPDPKRGEEVKAYLRLDEGWTAEKLPPQDILNACKAHLAAFKIPRYVAYVDDFPRTPTGKIAKERMKAEIDDLTAGAYDRVDDTWR
ncbi:MAG: class I adenylate-forming enzyme family protein [Silicimonas sp.]